MYIRIETNIPADAHPYLTRIPFAIAEAFGAQVTTAPREGAVTETRVLMECDGCGDMHYAPLCQEPCGYCTPPTSDNPNDICISCFPKEEDAMNEVIKEAMNASYCKCCMVKVEPSKSFPDWTPKECPTCYRYGCTTTENRCENNGHSIHCAVVPCNCD